MKNFYTKVRKELHKIPELSMAEYETARYIRNFLDNLEIPYQKIGTSTIALIEGERDSWVAFRADIDALPIEEETEKEYSSLNKGVMHACGHDGHMTNLLYLAKWLKESKDSGLSLKKSIMLIFQAGEEGAGGARFIAESPIFKEKSIEAIFAIHVYPELKEGTISAVSGPLTYQSIHLNISVKGKGCHGAQPFKGIDVILVTSKLIEAYQSIVSRNIEPEEPLIITIGSFHAGGARNIIPETAKLAGTIRLINRELIPFVQKRLEDINKGFETSYGVEINMEFIPFYPPVINSPELYRIFNEIVDDEKKAEELKLSGSEDFSFYLEEGIPGLMMLIGTRNEKKGFIYPLHNSRFDMDPEELILGFEVFKKFLERLEVF